MGTIECSQPASKSSWDSQDFGDISMVLKMAHFRKSTGPRWVKGAVSFWFSQGLLTLMCNHKKLNADINFFFFRLHRQRSKVYNWLQNFMI